MSFGTELTGFSDLDVLEMHLVPADANGFAPLLSKSAASKEARTQQAIEAEEAGGCDNDEALSQTRDFNEQHGARVVGHRDTSAGPGHVPNVRADLGRRDLHAGQGTTTRRLGHDFNNRVTTKENDMTPNELIKLLDDRDRAKKERKKAKLRKGTSESQVIKQLQAEIEALKNQPAGRLAAINSLSAPPGLRAIRRGEGNNPFAALEKAIAEAETPKERRAARDELTKAKILANAHIHDRLLPGRPTPLISQPPDAYANALAALGRRS